MSQFRLALIGSGLLSAFFFLALVLTSGSPSALERVYRSQSRNLQSSLGLSEEQAQRVQSLLEGRLVEERHLRRQMFTTYTPVQQARARQLWEQRRGRLLTLPERQLEWAALGASAEQRAQLEVYLEKLRAHREQTLLLVGQMLDPAQRTRLTALNFEL